MADKKEKPAEQASKEGAEAAPAKKGLPIKTIAVIAVVMAVEAAAIVLVMGMLSPKASEAAPPKELIHDDTQEIREIQIISDKFQNMNTGKVWVWDIDVYVQVKEKNAERVEKVLEQRSAEIKEGLSQIVSRAQHAHLKEPERQSLNRQFAAYLERVLGTDADGKPLIDRLLIPKCRGFPADF
jgi:flagellar basal body-associated protein FliL